MAVQQLSMVLTQLLISLMNQVPGEKSNHTIIFDKITNHVVPLFLFDKYEETCVREILNILGILTKNKVPVRRNRSYIRRKRFPSDKFLYKYKNKKDNTDDTTNDTTNDTTDTRFSNG